MNTHTGKKSIHVVQYMRGIAAFMVLLYHGSIFLGPYGKGIGGVLFGPAGDMGVDLFFIISGFIMVYTTRNFTEQKNEIKRFAINRISRIVPLYAACSVIAFILFNLFDNGSVSFDRLIFSMLFIPSGGGFGPVYGWPALNVGWTLNYEVYFYLVFFASMFFGKRRYLFLFSFIFSIIYFVPMLSGKMINSRAETSYDFSFNYLNLATNPIIVMFLFGVCIGLLYLSELKFSRFTSLVLCSASLLMVLAQYCFQYNVAHGPSQWGLSLIPFSFSFMLSSKTLDFPEIKSLAKLGDISYSLYLIHPLILPFNIKLMRLVGLGEYQKGFISLSVFALTSIIVSIIAHILIERMLSNKIREFLERVTYPEIERNRLSM